MTPAALLSRRGDIEGGSAIVEFVFVALVMLVPLVYLIAAVAVVQRTNLAVTTAARDAGRAYATSETVDEARQRARVAVRLALDDQGIDDDSTQLRFVAAGGGCDAPTVTPTLEPGSEFAVCVRRRVELPGIPAVLAGRGVTSIGMYVVHVDDFRQAPGA